MINISLETGPANEKVRQKLMIPFSFVISPGSLNSNIQTLTEEVQNFPRCQKCGAYFSKLCQKDESNSTWLCEICSHQNSISKEENEGLTNKFPEITTDDFQFVKKHQLGEEITVIYVSLNFHPKDYKIISTSLTDFFQNSNLSKPVLILLGQKEHDFSILAPYKSTYYRDSENNNIITKIKTESNELDPDEYLKTNDLPAPIFNLSSSQLLKEDISKFIFSPDQYPTIIKTIEKLPSEHKSTVPLKHFVNSIDTLRSIIQAKDSQMINPIHFVSILPSINDYFSSRFMKKIYDTLIRIDILTPTYNEEFQDTIQLIPGTVSLFNSGNLVRNLCKILLPPFLTKSSSEKVDSIEKNNEFHTKFCGYGKRGQGTVYQWNSYVRSNGCRTIWRLTKSPFSNEENGVTFSPVLPSTEQPFVLDIHPDGTSDNAIVQITAKMFMLTKSDKNEVSLFSSVFRVFNRKITLSSDVKKIARTINVNTLVWLWLTRTLDQPQRDVLAAIYRSTARIINLLVDEDINEDDQNTQKKSDKNDDQNAQKKSDENDDQNSQKKIIREIVHASCSLKLSDLMAVDEPLKNIARYSMVLSSPAVFRLVPKYDEKNKVAVFANSVFYDSIVKEGENDGEKEGQNDGENHQPRKIVSINVLDELMDILFMEKVDTPIPDWCKKPDPQTLEFIHSLISE